MNGVYRVVTLGAVGAIVGGAAALHAEAGGPPASSSLMQSAVQEGPPPLDPFNADAGIRTVSMFYVQQAEPRLFHEHDLVQIIVRETTQARSSQELETEKTSSLDAVVQAWPDLQLKDLVEFQIPAGPTSGLPEARGEVTKEFEGEGDYERRDDLTARLTAEVIEVQPNGNLVLEARTYIKVDDETAEMKVTGICRSEDVTAENSILSNQIHDLKIQRMHEGELRRANKKGIIAEVLDAIFAF